MVLLPPSLNLLLETLLKSKTKRLSIGQAIIQSARPRSSVLPLPFGLGVAVDNVFGSRWLVNELFRLGFSVSYDEVARFKQAVLQHDDINDTVKTFNNSFIQWVGDNVDHNLVYQFKLTQIHLYSYKKYLLKLYDNMYSLNVTLPTVYSDYVNSHMFVR